VVMLYVRFPLSLRNVENLLFERGIDVCHETVRLERAFRIRLTVPRQFFTPARVTACLSEGGHP